MVPVDASGIPEHALHFDPATHHGLDQVHDALASGSNNVVVVDDALSGGAVHDHLQHAENLVTHGDTVVHGHLPFITMALSGIREFDLLLSGKTDFVSAAKHAALDATGTGVGGAVGAKAGAGIGTIIWPGFGTVVGGIAGAIFGAIKGRKLTGNIKLRPFKAAVSAECSLAHFQSEAKIYEQRAAAELTEARVAQQALLKQSGIQARQVVEETKHALESWVVYDNWLQPDEACALIAQSLNEVARLPCSCPGRVQAYFTVEEVLVARCHDSRPSGSIGVSSADRMEAWSSTLYGSKRTTSKSRAIDGASRCCRCDAGTDGCMSGKDIHRPERTW